MSSLREKAMISVNILDELKRLEQGYLEGKRDWIRVSYAVEHDINRI